VVESEILTILGCNFGDFRWFFQILTKIAKKGGVFAHIFQKKG